MAKTRMNASMPIEATTVASIWILTSVTTASIGTVTMRTIMAIIAAMAPLAISLDLMDIESSRSYNYIDGTADRHGYMWYAIT